MDHATDAYRNAWEGIETENPAFWNEFNSNNIHAIIAQADEKISSIAISKHKNEGKKDRSGSVDESRPCRADWVLVPRSNTPIRRKKARSLTGGFTPGAWDLEAQS
jgi:hypothetical protein